MRMNVYLDTRSTCSLLNEVAKNPTLIYDQQIPRWQPHFGDLGRPSDASYIRSLARSDRRQQVHVHVFSGPLPHSNCIVSPLFLQGDGEWS